MASKRNDFAKKREQRQKMFVAVGGVVLLLVFAFEAKTLGLFGGGPTAAPPPPAAATTDPTSTNALTPPALPGTPAAPTPAPATNELADTEAAPAASPDGQLVAFDMFETKNPFAPQVKAQAAAPPAPPSTSVSAAGGTSPAEKPGADVTPASPAQVGASVTPQAGAVPAATTTTAVPVAVVTISVNGSPQRIGKDGTFPAGAPVFRLVEWSAGRARIGIVGGSYQSGDALLTLEQGKPVTLMNTSDGKRYKLVLLDTP